MRRQKHRNTAPDPWETEPIRTDWLRLSPYERLRRAWRMRRRIRDLQAYHDAKSLPPL